MISHGIAVRESEQFNYSKETIDKAKEKIKEFPTLNSILNNFSKANKENYKKNHFLILARDALSNPFIGNQPDMDAEAELKRYESLLNFLIPRLNKDSKKKLISRLKDFGENHSKTVLELELLSELITKESVFNVHYENPEKGNHDFCVEMGDTELNIELTSLGEGSIEKILKTAFSMAANEIIEQIPEDTVLRLEVDTSSILNQEGKNEPIKIKNILVQSFLKIWPIINVIRNNYCIIEKNLGDPEEYLYDFKDSYKYYNEFGDRLSKLLETPEGLEFLKKTKNKDISRIPISNFFIGDAKTKLVEIFPYSFWPSKAGSLRKDSILRQFRNRITEKIQDGQLKGKVNPIIAMNFYDWIFHDYSSNTDIFGQENLNELKDIIEEIFNQEEENEILGILLYEKTLKKSKFIKNPRISISKETILKINSLMQN